MLDMKFIRDNMEAIETKIRERRLEIDLSDFIQLDGDRRRYLAESDSLRYQKNLTSQKIADLKRDRRDASAEIAEMKLVSQKIKELDEQLRVVNESLETILINLPNIHHASVPIGASDADNVRVRTWGTPPVLDFEPKPHWELGEQLRCIHFKEAVRMAGSRFSLLAGPAARLERALINFMLDVHTNEHGYREIIPPFIVNENAMIGTGQLPHLREDLFKIEGSDHYLIPTAEVPLTNIHREEILDESVLPLRYVAYTPCFRREAGSWGKDTRGLIRVHQFNKVELVKIVRPEDSYDELELLVKDAERILQLLELPYQVMELCSADLSFSAAKCYDLEVWIETQKRYREVSSCSNFEDYQARRAQIRYRAKESGKTELVHTLNGSGLAIGRTLVALFENNQNRDGTIRIPKVLQPYLGGLELITPDQGRGV
ncbi:serine--tRNA ligase [bacterium]|nr:serine--tRNA ligase [bacterium]